MLKKNTYKTSTPKHTHNPLFLLKITFKSNNSHKNYHTNIMRINIFTAINKHKAKYMITARIP